ncbi:ABC transporter ATP-binding protein [Shewanella mangrovi]|uniref:ABC transporter ATP-binding protein n=1 Tax=Shewanella mangrovi TaxID=1515746 RepID=UPI0007B05757|nr:ABC transporter ATP-binding protein [Shewanella mangrovi]
MHQLAFHSVSHRFSALAKAPLLNNVSQIFQQPITLITGPNGSGKTTFLMIAAGLLIPTQGHVSFNQQPVTALAQKANIGISATKVALPAFYTAKELLQFHCDMFNCTLDTTWVDNLGLTPFLNSQIGELSLGNEKKLSLLTAILHQPQLLLLDEPFNGLDDASRAALLRFLQDFSGQLIIASHEPLQIADRAICHIAISELKHGADVS